MSDLRKKFEAIDIVFKSRNRLFITELYHKEKNLKKFNIFTVKDNSDKVQKLIEENRELLNKVAQLDKKALSEIESFNKEIKKVNSELEISAHITSEIKDDELIIRINTKEDEKIFIYKEDDYQTDLIDYMDNLHKVLLR